MLNQTFYLIIKNPSDEIEQSVTRLNTSPKPLINTKNLQTLSFSDYWEAIKTSQGINQTTDSDQYCSFVLNELGYQDFLELKDQQKFTIADLKNKDSEPIDLTKLEIKTKAPFGGGVIKGKKKDFPSAFNFWVNSITKITIEKFEIEADLDGGTYNPISLQTLEELVTNACGNLNQIIDKNMFVSAIELQNNSTKSGCFFVETIEEYFLIDVCCS